VPTQKFFEIQHFPKYLSTSKKLRQQHNQTKIENIFQAWRKNPKDTRMEMYGAPQ